MSSSRETFLSSVAYFPISDRFSSFYCIAGASESRSLGEMEDSCFLW